MVFFYISINITLFYVDDNFHNSEQIYFKVVHKIKRPRKSWSCSLTGNIRPREQKEDGALCEIWKKNHNFEIILNIESVYSYYYFRIKSQKIMYDRLFIKLKMLSRGKIKKRMGGGR